MQTLPRPHELSATGTRGPLVEVVVPVHNEQRVLEASVRRLHGYLSASFPFAFRITIADNALSTGLEALLPLVAPLVSGHSDLAIGTRPANGAEVVRGARRELISRCYNLLLRTVLRARFSDAQCGFKAGRAEVVRALLPVDWVEDPDSRVDVVRTALDDLRGMARVARPRPHPAGTPPSPRRADVTTTTLERPPPAATDPAWVRTWLLGLLAGTALLYLWALGASGWSNDFYSAAAQAASRSWKALFFGSLDASNFITVDKPPASLWVMGLSARLFGMSSWSILVPQALMGVATVALLYATVRRWFGPAAGLLAGAVLALTPVATLIFRFNNPDALLTLLLVAGAYACVRALEGGATGWLVLAGVCVGAGFLAKQLQALLVVPAFAVIHLAAAPGSPGRRLGQLAAAGAAMVATAGWWVAIVELTPASARPYVGGSQTDSVLELTFGYNGLGRLTGEETGSVGGGPGGGWGPTGWARMLGAEVGGQIAWLLPAALLLLAAGLWLTRRAPRTNRARAAFALWGGRLLVTAAVFSFMQGIFHAYYAVALAPAVAALVGMGATGLWEVRHHPLARRWLAGTMAVTAVWSWVLLRRTPGWHPELAPPVLVGGLAVAALVAALPWLAGRGGRRAAAAVAGAGLLVALAGPAAYALDTAATPHGGAIPSAGPAVRGAGPGGFRGGFPRGQPGFGRGGAGPFGQAAPGFGPGRRPGPGQGQGAMGSLLDGATPDGELVALLRQDADRYTWVAAAVGSNPAAGVQLATGEPVMAIGGFNGSDPAPSLEQFQRYVAEGRIHFFLGGGGMGRAMGGSDTAAEIAAWVADNFTPTSVGGATVYDLTTTPGASPSAAASPTWPP